MAKKTEADEDPIWVCVNGLIHNGVLLKHGGTYRASETEAVRRDQPESFIPWPALADEIRSGERGDHAGGAGTTARTRTDTEAGKAGPGAAEHAAGGRRSADRARAVRRGHLHRQGRRAAGVAPGCSSEAEGLRAGEVTPCYRGPAASRVYRLSSLIFLLWLRAVRDPEVRPVAARLYRRYRAWIADVIRSGVDSGEFRGDVNWRRRRISRRRCSTGRACGC